LNDNILECALTRLVNDLYVSVWMYANIYQTDEADI